MTPGTFVETIGRYRIIGELGKGAMGVVYKAEDPAIGRTVAVKTIRLSDLTGPSERERLRDRLFREARSAGILSHPNIVTIYDILEQDGLAYVFMEYVNGPSLEELLSSEGALTALVLAGVLNQTAGALDYAHKKGIVHRDIKPSNIMIDGDGMAKVTDFGVAKIASQQLTQAGAMMGTPAYMSPEQIQGGAVDGCADQWSLAVVAYEALTGEKPFDAELFPTLLYKICRDEPASVVRLNPSLSPRVDAVLRKALSKNAAGRYGCCCDFAADLSGALAECPGWKPLVRGASSEMETVAAPRPSAAAAPGMPPAERVAARRRSDEERPRRPLRTVALVSIALAALAVILFWANRGGSGDADAPAQAAVPQPAAQEPPPASELAKDKPSPVVAAPQTQETGANPPAAAQAGEPPPPGAVPAPKPAPPADSGRDPILAEIRSSPPGARVVIDGNSALTCVTPCSLALEAGRHVARATLEGHRESSRIFTTPESAGVTVALEPARGTLSVSSNPAGALIFLDGRQRAERTPAALRLAPGEYRLSVRLGGVQTDEETVTIRDGAISQRMYSLQ